MKSFILSILLLFIVFASHSQNTKNAASKRIADSMSDSLKLSVGQEKKIYEVNLLLSDKKDSVRKLSLDVNQLQRRMQAIENTRDSLYRIVLNSGQYDKYLRLKGSLISVKSF
jgi:uncharacterized coiled-coil protein SlyX